MEMVRISININLVQAAKNQRFNLVAFPSSTYTIFSGVTFWGASSETGRFRPVICFIKKEVM